MAKRKKGKSSNRLSAKFRPIDPIRKSTKQVKLAEPPVQPKAVKPPKATVFRIRQKPDLHQAIELWHEDRPMLLKAVAREMKEDGFNYAGQEKQQEELLEGLAFWEFYRGHMFDRYQCKSDLRRDFLKTFADSSEELWSIRMVAMINLLPILVWRRLLWRQNIDFVSRESFLRRLTPEQSVVIRDNYNDLQQGIRPRVFTAGEARRKEFQAESLLSNDLLWSWFGGDRERMEHGASKPAMSYNLLDLDFGFNAYPNGVSDDTKQEAVSLRRFFSLKNHANDFAVNTEFGRYFKLYRLARSNFAYKPGRKVELSSHICPGFWYTLILHLLFWVVSPVLFVRDLLVIDQVSIFNMFMAIPALFTPLLIFVGSVRSGYKRLEKRGDAVVQVLIGTMFVATSVLAIFGGWALKVYFLPIAFWLMVWDVRLHIRAATLKTKRHWFTPQLVALTILPVNILAVYHRQALAVLDNLFTIHLPFYYHKLIAVLSQFGGMMKWVVFELIPTIALTVWQVAISFGWLWLAILLPIAVYGAFFLLNRLLSNEQMAKLAIVVNRWAGLALFLFYVGLLFFGSKEYGMFTKQQNTSSAILFYTVAVCSCILAVIMTLGFKESNSARVAIVKEIESGHDDLVFSTLVSCSLDYESLIRNPWLRNADLETKSKTLIRLRLFLGEALNRSTDAEKHHAFNYLVVNVRDFETVARLEAQQDKICRYLEFGTRLRIIRLMIEQKQEFETARNIVEAELRLSQERWQLIERFLGKAYKVACWPFKVFRSVLVALIQIIWFAMLPIRIIVKKAWEYALTLYYFWELFQKSCPYVFKSKTIG